LENPADNFQMIFAIGRFSFSSVAPFMSTPKDVNWQNKAENQHQPANHLRYNCA
jgi:hypothetical protein